MLHESCVKACNECVAACELDANFLSGTAAIVYDETRVTPDDMKSFIADCGHYYRSEVLSMKNFEQTA